MDQITLTATVRLSDTATALHFTKPNGFTYRAGQYGDWTLLNPAETDMEGDTREFTLSSSPFEDHLACTVRLRDTAFKRVLGKLPIGATVELDAPIGAFVLHRDPSRPAVFVTGGIGITPARSIIWQAIHDRTGHRITLLYSAGTPAGAPYLAELTALAANHPNLTVVPTMTGPRAATDGWTGHTGRIDAALLTAQVTDLAEPIYYLCGPAAMLRGMHDVLAGAGVDTEDIRTEEFLGY